MTTVRAKGKQQFAYTELGNAAAAGLDRHYLSRRSLVPTAEPLTETTVGLYWGDPLRPHHFSFDEGTAVRPRLTTPPDILCHAVSVVGAGSFKENDGSKPVSFENGGIIVKGGNRYMFFTLEKFQKHFLLANGSAVQNLFEIDYQVPKK